jgi:hypothetical protein
MQTPISILMVPRDGKRRDGALIHWHAHNRIHCQPGALLSLVVCQGEGEGGTSERLCELSAKWVAAVALTALTYSSMILPPRTTKKPASPTSIKNAQREEMQTKHTHTHARARAPTHMQTQALRRLSLVNTAAGAQVDRRAASSRQQQMRKATRLRQTAATTVSRARAQPTALNIEPAALTLCGLHHVRRLVGRVNAPDDFDLHAAGVVAACRKW